ncbi:MAG: nucleoside recognition domain-containing protein [Desulfovibrionaceae bacterium]
MPLDWSISALPGALRRLVTDAGRVSLELFKVMIPVLVVMRLLAALDMVGLLAAPLGPVMRLVGLPAETGLIWAAGMLNNIYGGIAVYLSLMGDLPLTGAQATVLWCILLAAHSLPVEISIARRSGPRVAFQLACRILGGLLLGWLLHVVYSATGALAGPAVVLLPAAPAADPGWAAWAWAQTKNLAMVFGIIFCLLGLIRVLTALRVTEAMNALLRPVLRLMGIGERASTITIIGLTLGISYGGGLIIRAVREEGLDRRDVFFSLTLMGLCHSLFEDTLLMAMVGGHLSGILWARLAFALVAVAALVQICRRLPPRFADRFLWGPPRPDADLDSPPPAA